VEKNQLLLPTPLIKKDGIWLKREDKNPSGSVKDRAIVFQLAKAKKRGFRRVAISSSGNAAISLAFWAKKYKLKGTVFVSPHINPLKLKRLKNEKIEVKITPRPISECVKFCHKEGALNLRQSKDPQARRGFAQLGKELAKQLKERGIEKVAVFFPVSSGTTLLGTTEGLLKEGIKVFPFLVQPASHPPLASLWDNDFFPERKHLPDALVAKVFPLKEQIIKIIENNQGRGVVVQNKDIIWGDRWLKEGGICVSYEGGLVLGGIKKARKKGWISEKQPVVGLLTGKAYV